MKLQQFRLFSRKFTQPSFSILSGRKFYSDTPNGPAEVKTDRPKDFPVWKALTFTAVCGAGVLYYIKNEQDKIKASSITETLCYLCVTLNVGKVEPAGVVGTPKIGGPIKLTDQNGKIFDSTELKDKFMLVYFGFTHCPDVCPEELDKMTTVMKIVEKGDFKSKVLPVFITIDPERDGPKEIKEYLKDFHPDFVGLWGSKEEIKNLARKYRVYFRPARTSGDNETGSKDYLVDHSIFFFLVDPEGNYVSHFSRESTPERCAKVIQDSLFAWDMTK